MVKIFGIDIEFETAEERAVRKKDEQRIRDFGKLFKKAAFILKDDRVVFSAIVKWVNCSILEECSDNPTQEIVRDGFAKLLWPVATKVRDELRRNPPNLCNELKEYAYLPSTIYIDRARYYGRAGRAFKSSNANDECPLKDIIREACDRKTGFARIDALDNPDKYYHAKYFYCCALLLVNKFFLQCGQEIDRFALDIWERLDDIEAIYPQIVASVDNTLSDLSRLRDEIEVIRSNFSQQFERSEFAVHTDLRKLEAMQTSLGSLVDEQRQFGDRVLNTWVSFDEN
ncbi:MAG: hypothetical protein AAF292_11120 [Pseudomonadota bacterium]